MDETDIALMAMDYFDQFGIDAPIRAAMKAGALLERGDLDGASMWRRIAEQIAHVLTTTPNTG